MKFLKLKISSKALLFFLIVALLPLVAVSFVQVSAANSQLLKAAETKQQIVATDLAYKADNYLTDKINQLVFQSYISADLAIPSLASRDLTTLISQDKALDSVYFLNAKGLATIGYDRQGQINPIPNADQSNGDAYKAAYFLSGKPYIGSVSYDKNNNPFITIAVPLLQPNTKPSAKDAIKTNPDTFGTPNDIRGVLVANYNISDLWQTVLSTTIGRGGYAYVVDGLGNLVAHPNKSYLAAHQKLTGVQAVDQFRNGSLATKATKSETGQKVISTPRPLSQVGWAVIVEEPESSIYSNVNAYIRLSATVGIIVIIISVLIAIFFSRQLIDPIKKLSISAQKLGNGQLDAVVNVHTNDELQDLAEAFNRMSSNIKQLVSDLSSNNVALSTEEIKLNRIIDNVSDGVVAINASGAILSVNPPAATLINQQPATLIGAKLADIFPWERDDKRFTPETTKPGLYSYSDLVLTIGNKVSYVDMVVYVLDHNDDDMTAIITIRDLTKSRELDFMKLDFVAIAAHELRTPLTVVRGYLDMLNSEAVSQMSVFNIESLQKAIVGADQLRNLINKLLNIAHIERGEMEIFIEKLNLAKLVTESVHQHQTPAAQRMQKLTLVANEAPVYVPADPASITEVLNNLIGNAIKYTPEKGKIQVSLHVDNDTVRVAVTDNGPGIPEELRTRLFTKFYRAERSLIAGTRGTGLGLFISKTIIELQGGKIGLEPDRGHGSTFYFSLPVYKTELHDKLLAKDKQRGGVRGWFKKRPNR